ncbi:MAG: aldo/keto reductase [Anaerolineae bacterium]|nr:aldo/keto reductase [Anaerolineae bacterium]
MIAKQPFGRTGHMSTRTIFGSAALWALSQSKADRTLGVLKYYDVNHIDTAASYGDAELRIGPWMAQHRDEFFLATKTDKRSYQEAWEQIRLSLERLQVDCVDLLQLHNLVDPEEWEVAMGPDGALKAVLEARDQGLTRFIGVTGHGVTAPAMHLRSLERFDFDSALLPLNYVMMQNEQYAADFETLLAVCRERDVAVQTIKSIARGEWGKKTHTRTVWYEPLEDQVAIDKAVQWVLGWPGVFLNTAGDVNLLPKVLDAAVRFKAPPSDEAMQELVKEREIEPLFV